MAFGDEKKISRAQSNVATIPAAPSRHTGPPPLRPVPVRNKPKPHKEKVTQQLAPKKTDKRFARELSEMQETHDLDEVDDDVEKEATLYEWRAKEHEHRPKSPVWFAALAAATTVIIGLQLFFFFNILGAIVIATIGMVIYYIAQQKPRTMRYRIMLDGIAINTTLYHWQDLASFNVIYEPGESKTVIFRSHRKFSPYIHMEIENADPVEIREILLEFLAEDQGMDEPMADIIARRLGF